jgi:hypothetical protein
VNVAQHQQGRGVVLRVAYLFWYSTLGRLDPRKPGDGVGSLTLGDLAEGEWRILSPAELDDQEWGAPADRR